MEKILTNEKRGKENEEQVVENKQKVEENAKILKEEDKKKDEKISTVAKKSVVNTDAQEALVKAGLI